MTPEGKVKAAIKALLDKYGVYYFMPVQMGLGPAGLDFHCVINDHSVCGAVAFFVEAKAPGKKPTDRQNILITTLRERYNAEVFVVHDDVTLVELEIWLKIYKVNSDERASSAHNQARRG